MAPSLTRGCGIRTVVNIIILIEYIIPIKWSHGQEDALFVLTAAWKPNNCPENIDTVPREMLTGAFNLPHAGYLWIGVIDFIP
jgi:hypothetical protein